MSIFENPNRDLALVRTRFAGTLALILAWTGTCRADPLQDVLDAARIGWTNIDQTYSQLSFSATVYRGHELSAPKPGQQRREEMVIKFRCLNRGLNLLLDGQLEYSKKGTSVRNVLGVNDSYSFRAIQKDSGLLLKKSGEPGSPSNAAEAEPWVLAFRPATTMSILEPIRIQSFIADKSTRLTGVEVVGSLRRIRYQREQPSGNSAARFHIDGYFDLEPTRNWRLVESGYSVAGENSNCRTLIKYSAEPDEDRVLFRETITEGTSAKSWERVEFSEFSQTPNHPEVFYLSHYGLPEPPGVVWDRPTPIYVWLLIAAGGFGGIALGCRWQLKRRARAVTPKPTV